MLEVLSIILLLGFLGINVTLTIVRLSGRIAGVTLKKTLRIDVPKNEKKILERFFTPIWILVGLWGVWKTRWDILAMVFAFLAFRSGANVSRTLVYSIHDGKLVEEYTRDSKILGIVGKATRISLLLEGIFVIALALAYKTLSAATNPSGSSSSLFLVELWTSGLIFGAIFGWLIAKNNRGILLENQIAIVWLFAGKKGKEKTEEVLKKTGGKVKGIGKYLER
ncbi:hypothetical protein [Thermococcus sp.]